jgi:hypothetical protein
MRGLLARGWLSSDGFAEIIFIQCSSSRISFTLPFERSVIWSSGYVDLLAESLLHEKGLQDLQVLQVL